MTERSEPIQQNSIFGVPVLDLYLIYAPLHNLAALVDRLAVRRITDWLTAAGGDIPEGLDEVCQNLRSQPEPVPLPREGSFVPAFLGLIPTRGCNLGCEYCGFLPAGEPDRTMDLELARDAITWYFDLVRQSDLGTAEIHFFGGEPFCAEEVVDLAFHYAWLEASRIPCSVRFEVATNGTFDEERCRWAADSLDSIILSLDGPADIQDRHRHRKDGKGSFDTVVHNARILSEGTAELSFRTCVTADTVGRMPEIAAWLCREFRPVSVSFEPVQPSAPSRAAGLSPPDPWAFAQGFIQAGWILESFGVQPVYAAADIRARRVSFCPVGQDVPIVLPDGTINACYLLEGDWHEKGLDLRLGSIEHGTVLLDESGVAAARDLSVQKEPFCAQCFCKWHCAGGCHVNHVLSGRPGEYDRLCIQTRIITLRNILKAMDREDLVRELLKNRRALERAAWQTPDTLVDQGSWT